MRQYRFISLILLLMLFLGMGRGSVFANGKVYLGYCNGQIATASSGTIMGLTGNNVVVAEAIRLSGDALQPYIGMSLSAVHAGMVDTPGLPDELTAWVRTSLDGVNLATGTSTAPTTGWNEIALSSAYTITGQETELWIGFEFVQQKKMTIISFAGDTHDDGCWLGKNNSFSDYSGKNFGSLSVEAVIEGEGLASHDLSILNARAKKALIHLDQPISLLATVANNAVDEAVNPVLVCYYEGREVTRVVYEGVLKQLDKQNITLDIQPDVFDAVLNGQNPEGTFALDLQLLWNDSSADEVPEDNEQRVYVTRSETFYTRRMVVEEGTGGWCGYCVRGIVGMKYMHETYPDRFIGIAVHNGDEYEMADYSYYLSGFFSGYPNCIINRNGSAYQPTVEELENYLVSHDSETDCDILLTAQMEDGLINIQTTTTFLSEQLQNTYRMAFVVCEDKLPLRQKNYYSGGSLGEMGGFENLPSVVDTEVDDVARGIYPSAEGVENVFPEAIHRLETYEYNCSFQSPAYNSASNLWVAVLLIDGDSKQVVQAAKTKVEAASGLQSVSDDSRTMVARKLLNKGRIEILHGCQRYNSLGQRLR